MATSKRSELLRGDLKARAKPLRPVASQARRRPEGVYRLLAHDLKTSLASIAMNLDFAMAELPSSGGTAVAPALEDCREANARAIRIVSDMADGRSLCDRGLSPEVGYLEVSSVGWSRNLRWPEATSEAAVRAIDITATTDQTRVLADADLLSRVIDRLLERALRQARVGTWLDVQQKHRSACDFRATLRHGGECRC